MFSNENQSKICSKYYCKSCDYNTSKKSSYTEHLLSRKHQKSMIFNQNLPKICPQYVCKFCNKKYKDNSGLWRHKKKCNDNINSFGNENANSELEEPTDKQLIMLLIKENGDLKNMMMEVIKNGTHNTTNSHNKSFNLQLFLNETCKDAMNIMDFVDSLKLQLSDLENVGKLGFVEGLSNIIVKNLKALDVHKRPVHCSDSKREVMYIKDENKWEKDNEDKIKLRKVIKHIAHKNSKLIPEFREKYPDCGKSNSTKSDQYNKLVIEAMGGSGDNDSEKENKIIKKIAREVSIDKTFEM